MSEAAERPWRAVRRVLAFSAALLVAATLLVAGQAVQPTAPAEAAPTPDCETTPVAGTACLRLYAGDYRAGDYGVSPLAGVTFGLFLANPVASISDDDGFSHPDAGHPLYFTCQSGADGYCYFTVPIRAGAPVVGAEQEPGDDPTNPYPNLPLGDCGGCGVPQGTRLYAAVLDVQGDYYANPWWQTGNLQGTTPHETRHVFQSPQLVAGQIYRNGIDWVTDPGLQTTPATTNPSEYTRRIASGGRWPMSRFNPDLLGECGLDVALVVDVSSSIATTGGDSRADLVDAMDAFVGALQGTPSRIALYTFGSDSPANGVAGNGHVMNFDNVPLTSVGTLAEAQAFAARYAGWDDGSTANWPTNYTNWDRGFAAAALSNEDYDLAIFLTDGNPTVYGPAPLNPNGTLKDSRSGFTRFREVGDGVVSANLLKSEGTRILAVGVGDEDMIGSPGAAENLRSVSGRDPFTPADPNLDEADYFQTDDYDLAAELLRDIVLEPCAPTVSVVKRIVPNGTPLGTPEERAAARGLALVPSEPWEIELTAEPAEGDPVTITPSDTESTDLETGSVVFNLDFDEEQEPLSLSFVETGQGAYRALPGLTQCTNKNGETVLSHEASSGDASWSLDASDWEPGDPIPESVAITGGMGDPGDDMQVVLTTENGLMGLEDMVSCVVYNMAPAESEPATVSVDKWWGITIRSEVGVQVYEFRDSTMPIPEGESPAPAYLTAQLLLSEPGDGSMTSQAWNAVRTGYDVGDDASESQSSVTIDETVVDFAAIGRPGCELTQQWIQEIDPETRLGIGDQQLLYEEGADDPPTFGLEAGENAWRIMNYIECESTLTLVKELVNGQEVTGVTPEMWQLTAFADPDTLPSPFDGLPMDVEELADAYPGPDGTMEGDTGVTAEVFPEMVYQLGEFRPVDPPVDSPGHYSYHYLQLDNRSCQADGEDGEEWVVLSEGEICADEDRAYPQSTGSWDCYQLDADGNPIPESSPSLGSEGAVAVPAGMAYECVASNATALITVDKSFDPEGSGDPEDYAFRAYWVDPLYVPASQTTDHEFPGGETQSLVPSPQHYGLCELGAPPCDEEGALVDSTLSSLVCTTDGVEIEDIADFALPRGAEAVCQAVNLVGNWTASKGAVPASGTVVDPGDEIGYTVTAQQLLDPGVSRDVVVVDDLAGVLDGATLDEDSITASAGDAVFDAGTQTISWTIPELTGEETLSYTVTVDEDALGAVLRNVLVVEGGLGCEEAAEGDYGVDFAADCDETEHPTEELPPPPGPEPPDMALTGMVLPWIGIAGAGLALLVGAGLTVASVLRRRPT